MRTVRHVFGKTRSHRVRTTVRRRTVIKTTSRVRHTFRSTKTTKRTVKHMLKRHSVRTVKIAIKKMLKKAKSASTIKNRQAYAQETLRKNCQDCYQEDA